MTDAINDGRGLVFRLGRRRFGIALEAVRALVELTALRSVPGAPPEILGLAVSRGRVLTIVDLARALGEPAVQGPACLARLAAPLDSTALLLPQRVRVAALDGEAVTLIDPPAVVRAVENAVESLT